MYSKLSLLCLLPFVLLTACDKKETAPASASSTAAAVDSAAIMERSLAAAEAKAHVIGITRAVMAAALKEAPAGDTLPTDDEAPSKKLPDSTTPVPVNADDVKGKAYTSKEADWESWKTVGFKVSAPQKCQYEWKRARDTQGTASAKCDFDGDGTLDYHVTQDVGIIGGAPKISVLIDVVPLKK